MRRLSRISPVIQIQRGSEQFQLYTERIMEQLSKLVIDFKLYFLSIRHQLSGEDIVLFPKPDAVEQ